MPKDPIIDLSGANDLLSGAAVVATGLSPAPTGYKPPDFLLDAVASALEKGPELWPPDRKAQVRDLLRFGRYKPSGRAKPSSEFLLGAAQKDAFPSVFPLVDINNVVSLLSGFPASIFDLEQTGPALHFRRGAPDESYVFNSAGHEIRLEDLLLVCCRRDGEWSPCGNPVKDSMATKVHEATTASVSVIYAPLGTPRDDLQPWADRYALLLQQCAGATVTKTIYF